MQSKKNVGPKKINFFSGSEAQDLKNMAVTLLLQANQRQDTGGVPEQDNSVSLGCLGILPVSFVYNIPESYQVMGSDHGLV